MATIVRVEERKLLQVYLIMNKRIKMIATLWLIYNMSQATLKLIDQWLDRIQFEQDNYTGPTNLSF